MDFVVSAIVKESRTSFDVLGGKLYLYPYINGDVVKMDNDKFPKDMVNTLTEILIKLHKVTPSINTQLPVEDYTSDNRRRFNLLLASNPLYNSNIFLQTLTERKEKIDELITKYENLGNTLKLQNIQNILTHGDVTGLNFINTGEKLYLTDWDGAMLAPPERDLNFLVSNPNFSIEHYLQETGKVEYREDIKDYYGMRWSLDSILCNLEVLASIELKKNDIKEIIDEIDKYINYYCLLL
ncbi:MAG: spectinomycin phosphotransferase [uncultured bacterium]|nr:MAG: spectinomycin phosphotransferase [uncultured bacterium]